MDRVGSNFNNSVYPLSSSTTEGAHGQSVVPSNSGGVLEAMREPGLPTPSEHESLQPTKITVPTSWRKHVVPVNEAATKLAEAFTFFSKRPNITPQEAREFRSALDHDSTALKEIIVAENHRNPGLELHYAASCDDLNKIVVQSSAVRIRIVLKQPLPYKHEHYIAVDVAKSKGVNSYVIVDSLAPSDDQSAWAAHLLREQLPRNSKAVYLTTDQEKAWIGCHIFSLSYALKMHECQDSLDNLHSENFKSILPWNGQTEVEERDDRATLPTVFYKHAQSANTIGSVIAARGENPIVNKRGETLLKRHINKRGLDGKSTSIEDKRLLFHVRALSHNQRSSFAHHIIAPAFAPIMGRSLQRPEPLKQITMLGNGFNPTNEASMKTLLACMSELAASACASPVPSRIKAVLQQNTQLGVGTYASGHPDLRN